MTKLLQVLSTMTIYDILNLCDESKSKSEIFKKLNISDNKPNWDYFNLKLEELDISINKKQLKRYCLNCGKELSRILTKFCCTSCAATYNNLHRDKSVYNKIGHTLKNYYNTANQKDEKKVKTSVKLNNVIKKEILKRYCLNCGKELQSDLKMFCCNNCCNTYKSHEHYNYYINHQDEFCRSNFVPRTYIREAIIKEQKYKCDICGCNMEHNGKPLVFVLDHIDGNAANNYRNNLRLICPNCDSQLSTFKSKNKHSARRDYFREHIKDTVIEQIKSGDISI